MVDARPDGRLRPRPASALEPPSPPAPAPSQEPSEADESECRCTRGSAHDHRIRDGGDDLHSARASRTFEDIDYEHSLEQLGPGQPRRPRRPVLGRARLDDGLFDVVTLGDLAPMDFLRDGHRVCRGAHLDMSKVSFRRARRVDARPIDAHEDVLLDVDGEALGALPARFNMLPRALDLMVP